MEKNMSLNLSLVKMPHSNFKDKAYAFNTGVGKCSKVSNMLQKEI